MKTAEKSIDAAQTNVYRELGLSQQGLTRAEAQRRLALQRRTKKMQRPWVADLRLLLRQFKSPLVLLLVFALLLSASLGEYSDGAVVLAVLLTTGILGFLQERKAGKAVQALLALVHSKATVRRSGREQDVFIEDVVKGDLVLLNAGDVIPADALVLEAKDLHVNESALTGESFPVERFALTPPLPAGPANKVCKGTSVINGAAIVVAIATGNETELGKIARSVEKTDAATRFEKDINGFGRLLVWWTLAFSAVILFFNLVFHRPLLDSLLFSLALAVGITPELLPAILTITLAAGAKRLASQNVIVKKLNAIQNLGQIDVLCTDKTGTITEGVVTLTDAIPADEKSTGKLRCYAYLNACFETGFSNPIDEAVRRLPGIDVSGYKKFDEVPYDFSRKRLSVVVEKTGRHWMITKGAFHAVLPVCSRVETAVGIVALDDLKSRLERRFDDFSARGFRVIALAYKDVSGAPVITHKDEADMVYLGMLVFADPLKEGVKDSIRKLKTQGIAVKIITGDNARVALYAAAQIGLRTTAVLTGADLEKLSPVALVERTKQVDVFAEVRPAQKEAIVRALQKSGHAVGYLGDGINDANALKAADVGISVDDAVDVAKEAADFVLLSHSLSTVSNGVEEGRKTLANTAKYIFVTTSANFGNMISMAVASLVLPFMPLLPIQILLNNFLSDLPAFGIASDNVDNEWTARPSKWQIGSVQRFMAVFGLQSSLFDFATFGLLYFVFAASPQEFRTAWFTESLLTEILLLLVFRTRRTIFRSRPSSYLLTAVVISAVLCLAFSYLPFAGLFGFVPLPAGLLLAVTATASLYFAFAERTKKWLYTRMAM